ncbi:ankyrin repeat-containing domain protein [Roridomyces roridus]|uniref:Ankyrin repeat-containing domain protein n=1 Tax=Roridomyces roridus TaxID=1738132 RepID=A0AAD7FZJ1_9AGAR|nr:ankyrin repeat-containing domain protein [Roridomyces roridus]
MSKNYFNPVPPELVALISTTLSNASLDRFILTCRRFHAILQPELESRLTPALAQELLPWAAASKPHITAQLDSLFSGSPTPLHMAVRAGNLESAALLLEAGADPTREVEMGDLDYLQPLHVAARRSDSDMIKLLLDHGAPIDSLSVAGQDDASHTALHIACSIGHLDTVELLVSRGADISVCGNWGPALSFAVHADRLQIVKYLLENGADASISVSLEDIVSLPPSANLLYIAMGIRKLHVAPRWRARMETPRWDGLPLDEKRKQIMALLLAHGCSTDAAMETITMHLTALAKAAGHGEEEFLQMVREMIKQAEDAIAA